MKLGRNNVVLSKWSWVTKFEWGAFPICDIPSFSLCVSRAQWGKSLRAHTRSIVVKVKVKAVVSFNRQHYLVRLVEDYYNRGVYNLDTLSVTQTLSVMMLFIDISPSCFYTLEQFAVDIGPVKASLKLTQYL